jgi:competence protein ComEC
MIQKNRKIAYFILAFLSVSAILVWMAVFAEVEAGKLKVNFYNIGQGDSALIEASSHNQVLIDGGPNSSILEKLGEDLPFYDRKIELVILTHPDKDHLFGLVEVLKRYEVKQILTTGILCSTAICKEWEKLIEKKNIPVKIAQAGQIIKIGNGINLLVLHPFENLQREEVKNKNNASIINLLVYGENSFLFTGDAEMKVERKLIKSNVNLRSDILKVSHHGSKGATSDEFLKYVMPKTAIISVGKNSWGMPRQELLERLDNNKIKVYRTDEDGDVRVISDGINFLIDTEKDEQRKIN